MLVDQDADGFSCADRIKNVMAGNVTEVQACRVVANQYAACRVNDECNPNVCDEGRLAVPASNGDDGSKGKPWAWAVLSFNAIVCLVIVYLYKRW